MTIPFLSAIAALIVTAVFPAGPVEGSGSSDQKPNRFVIHDGTLAISRPDPSWEFKVDASKPPTVAKMSSPDKKASADVQVQRVPGMTLARIRSPIEQAVAAQTRQFRKLSGRDVEVHGTAAHELSFTATSDGEPHRAKMLIVKPGDTLYIVKCSAPDGEWRRFESQCNAILASFELLPEERKFVSKLGHDWGRRIEWEADAGPEAREHASFILDPSRDRAVMLLGSGYQPYLDPLGDAWVYDLTTDSWSQLELEGDAITPGGSRRAAPIEGGAFIHGGYGKDLASSRDLWKLRFGKDRIRVTLIKQENAPVPRSLHGFAVDTKGERFVIFGGGGPTTGTLGDTWIGTKRGNSVSWRELKLDVDPGPRYGFAFAHDEKRGRLIVCSGQIPASDESQVEKFALDTWALDFTADEPKWTLLAEYDPGDFPGRRNPAFTFDQRSGDLFVWGGAGAEDTVIPDLFIVQTRDDRAPVQRVSQPALIAPRASGFGVVDPKRSRALMGFGNIRAGAFLDLVEVKLRQ